MAHMVELEKSSLESTPCGIETIMAEKTAPDAEVHHTKYGQLLDLHGNEFFLPDYTIKQIYDAIPAECFERNIFKSLRYVVQDLSCIIFNFYVFNKYATPQYVPSFASRFALWTLYAFIQGLFGLGIWVLAHDCGHMAFSTSKIVNDTVGLVLHSSLLVPYFSWKITHRNHHKGIANMATDTSFVPVTRLAFAQRFGKTLETIAEHSEDTPIYQFFYLFVHQLFDWQAYMLIMIGVGEHWFEKKAKMNGEENPERNEDGTILRKYRFKDGHYNPYSPLFAERDAKFILLTDIALLVVCSMLIWVGRTYGWANLAVWYGVPYLWVNHWLMSLTYLHHSDGSLPHYNPKVWTFIRGAASTIDRDFGFVGRHIFHNIIDTHVLHHHVSVIPHYHSEKASAAIKPVMGIHYKEDKSGQGMWNFMVNYWKNAKSCTWVEPSIGAVGDGVDVLFYRNRIGAGVRPVELKAKGGQ